MMTIMAALFAIQSCVPFIRQRADTFLRAVQYMPVLFTKDGAVLIDALRQTRLPHSDFMANLREANTIGPSSISLVIFKTTGGVAVFRSSSVDEVPLQDIARLE